MMVCYNYRIVGIMPRFDSWEKYFIFYEVIVLKIIFKEVPSEENKFAY